MSKKGKKNSTESLMKDALTSVKGRLASLYLLMMFVVFVLYAPEKYGMLANNKLLFYRNVTIVFYVLSLLLIIVSLIQRHKKTDRKKISVQPVDVAMLLYGGINLISFLLSDYKSGAMLGYEGWRMGLLTQLSLVISYFIISRFANKENYVLEITAGFFVLESLMVVLQRCTLDPFGFYSGMDWMAWNRRNLLGTIGNINWLAGCQACLVPVVILTFIRQKKWYLKLAWGVGVFVSLAALILQSSRSALVFLAAILAVLFFFSLKEWKRVADFFIVAGMLFLFMALFSTLRVKLIEPEEIKGLAEFYSMLWWIPTVLFFGCAAGIITAFRKKTSDETPKSLRMAVYIAAGVLFISAIGLFIVAQFNDALLDKVPPLSKLRLNDASGSYRILLWKQSVSYFFSDGKMKNFLFGLGPDCYGYWSKAKNISLPVIGPFAQSVYTNAHNDYLTTFMNLGLIGLILYLSLFVTTVIELKKQNNREYFLLGLMLIAAYGVHNFFSFQQICSTPIFFLLIAFLLRKKKE